MTHRKPGSASPPASDRPGSDARSELPVGVFDSGVGGLTVLRAIRRTLPDESVIYLGDTARVPYGTKSGDSVVRYALQAAELLVDRGIKLLVVACNTASAVALDALRERLSPLPVLGVIEPGARAAAAASANGHFLVLATEATVQGHAYARALHALRADAVVEEIACSLFVALAEEGWTDGPVADAIAETYLGGARHHPRMTRPDCAILGCTHFPLLAGPIRRAIGESIAVVDSATTTADAVRVALDAAGLACGTRRPATFSLMATDNAARFARVGSAFLGVPIAASDVELVDV
jgi:glutamate racemase